MAKVWCGVCSTPSIGDMERHADPFDVDASHAKLGEHYRMAYLVLMFRAMFPLGEWLKSGQLGRVWRTLWARYADPIGEWDPGGDGVEMRAVRKGTTCVRRWRPSSGATSSSSESSERFYLSSKV